MVGEGPFRKDICHVAVEISYEKVGLITIESEKFGKVFGPDIFDAFRSSSIGA